MNSTAFYYALGRPFSPLYTLAMHLRAALYRRRIFTSHRLACPVISVGNLTMGGTGKTPIVQHLARLLQAKGYCPAIISRGYRGEAQGKVNIVSDSNTLYLDAQTAGDEPRLLAETLAGVPVLTGVVRKLPAEKALEMGANVLLLDDGFQHMQLVRDVNLALFHADRLAGNSRVFPAGDLREPVAALKRASHFMLTGVHEGNAERAGRFGELLQKRFPNTPVVQAGYEPDGLVRLDAERGIIPVPVDDSAQVLRSGSTDETKAYAFCGIAAPERFLASLERFGIALGGHDFFRDHQSYDRNTLELLVHQAQDKGACFLVTTEKDLVKLTGLTQGLALPVYALRMRVLLESAFEDELLRSIADFSVPGHLALGRR